MMKLRVSWKFTQYNTPEHIEEALNGLNAKINSRRRFQILRSVMRYAAVILLFVSFLMWDGLSETGQLCNDQGGTRGRCEKIVLADGSAVWLKEGSSLRIPEVFAENNRKLSLQGEAFFDVAKNAQYPLYVSTNYVNIKVLGTAFNVKTDEKHQNVETVLARGKVALLDKQWNPI